MDKMGDGLQAKSSEPVDAGLKEAVHSMKAEVASFTYGEEEVMGACESGHPEARTLVLGGGDSRDDALAEEALDESVAWKGRIFNVDRLTVRLPDGREAVRDVVRHPGAVAIIALTDGGRICLVRQYRTALGRVTVEIPAGKLDPGEDPLDCARRELLEETGMAAKKIAFLTTIATSAGFCDELIHIYMATGLSYGCPNPDEDEFLHVDLVELSELVDAVLDGRIEDAKTVVGVLACDAIAHRLSTSAGVEGERTVG